jgi:ATP synthase I chain
MSEIAASAHDRVELRDLRGGLELRLQRAMIGSVALAVVISGVMAPWRFTTGLVLGGLLSILNFRWLHTSVAAIFNINLAVEQPRAGASRYLLRYIVVAGLVIAAVSLQIVSLPATLAGLTAFVPALFIEAVREFYLAIIHREESS